MTASILFYVTPIIIAILLFWTFYLVWKYTRKELLSTYRKEYYRKKIEACKTLSKREIIIESDNILCHILSELWYRGNVADQLRRKPYIAKPFLEELWRLHKLRNRIVHELDVWEISGADAQAFMRILYEMVR